MEEKYVNYLFTMFLSRNGSAFNFALVKSTCNTTCVGFAN